LGKQVDNSVLIVYFRLSPFTCSCATWLSSNQTIEKNSLGDPMFLKTCFVLDTTDQIIFKNGELGISFNIVISESMLHEGNKF
jgi:hypothetical protein